MTTTIAGCRSLIVGASGCFFGSKSVKKTSFHFSQNSTHMVISHNDKVNKVFLKFLQI